MRGVEVIAALSVLALASTGAWADDSVATMTPADAGIVYATGGAAATDGGGFSILSDLRHMLADTTFTVGANPVGTRGIADESGTGYKAYADVGLGGFSIGGRFTQFGDTSIGGSGDQSFGIGASYSLDSLTVGIDWSRGNYDEVFLDVGDEDADVVAFTSSYALRPGVRVNGLLEYSEQQPADKGDEEGAFTVGIGTLISF